MLGTPLAHGADLLALIFGGSWDGAWLALLGWFLLQAAGMEARSLVLREALGGVKTAGRR
jgi:hypothetical protein